MMTGNWERVERGNAHFAFDLRGLTLLVIAGAWVAGILLSAVLLLPTLAILLGIATASLCLIPLWRDVQARLVMLTILCLLLGGLRYAIALPDSQAIASYIGNKQVEVSGSVSDEPELEGSSRVFQVAVSAVSADGGTVWQNADGTLEVRILGTTLDSPYGPNYGDSVQLQGKVLPPTPTTPMGVFASMAFPRLTVTASGGTPLLAAIFNLRIHLATVIEQSLPQPEAATLVAILLGLRTPALHLLTAAFNETGTAHLIAPSGFKVTILAGLVAAATRWLYETPGKQSEQQGMMLPAQRRKKQRRHWLATGIVIASIAFYTVLSGLGPAAIRAGIMGSLLVLAPRIGRTYNVYTALAAAALIMSAVDPFVLWDAGFQLSFLGTLGIALFTPLFMRALAPLTRLPAGHTIAELFAVSLAAQISTIPIIALTFNLISFIAPLTNLLTVGLLAVLLSMGLLVCGTGLIFAPLGILFGWATWPLLWYVDTIVSVNAGLPWSYQPVTKLNSGLAWGYYGLLALVISFVLRRQEGNRQKAEQVGSIPPAGTILPGALPALSKRTWRLMQVGALLVMILATGLTALASQPDGRLAIMFLPVGPAGQAAQGQAILIKTPDSKFILLDGGPDATSLAQQLDSRLPPWQRSLAVVALTSPRTDHLTGLQDVVTRFQIGEVLDAGMLHPNTGYALWRRTINERHLHYIQVRQGTTIPVGTQVTLQIFWPPTLHKSSNEELDNGLVIRLLAPGLSILFLGAAAMSTFALSGLLETINAHYLQADIVQVMGETGKAFPAQLATLLQETHSERLIITSAALTPKQRKAGATPVIASLPSGVTPDNVIQTAQVGTVIITAENSGWSVNSDTT
ncbi:MAG TPA: ComEC/Rec2 family competence protein [Ktedonobacteraceae bacterium]|nr:ComEC/Rec2 family competence protein [Ktedonobacteraceae bacterium]